MMGCLLYHEPLAQLVGYLQIGEALADLLNVLALFPTKLLGLADFDWTGASPVPTDLSYGVDPHRIKS